jgi:hypothetical protein
MGPLLGAVEKAKSLGTTLDVVEGMQSDRRYTIIAEKFKKQGDTPGLPAAGGIGGMY